MTTSGVYAIRNTRSGESYIGSSVNVDRRWALHVSALKRHRHSNKRLQTAWNQDGSAVFALEILERLPPDPRSLDQAERLWFERSGSQGIALYAARHHVRRDITPTRPPAPPQPVRTRGAATVKVPSLRHWRVQRMLLQEDLAEVAKIANVSVRRGENGEALRLTTVRALAAALKVPPTELMAQPPVS